jgi:hypothetical protein
MSDKRSRQGLPVDGSGILAVLDEDAAVEVLRAAKAARVLGPLASCSSSLCSLARSRVFVSLHVQNQRQAGLIITSAARSRPPFSGCTDLYMDLDNMESLRMAVGVLNAVQGWTGLRELTLSMSTAFREQQEAATLENCTSSILSAVPSLQQLRRVDLYPGVLGACSMRHVLQLTQLTSLMLTAWSPPIHTAVNYMALARLTNLLELRLAWALAPPLPAGPEGPYCLPSSLVTLELCSAIDPAPLAHWLAHVPGCVQLQELELRYRAPQHHSTHPRALVELFVQHSLQPRSLQFVFAPRPMDFSAHVLGLPDAEDAVDWLWRPNAGLAAMSRLESLCADSDSLDTLRLYVEAAADWQCLAQVPRLQKLYGMECCYAPPHPAGTTLSVLRLTDCGVHLGGYETGCLLLACPLLEYVKVLIMPQGDGAVMCVPAGGARLPPHPTLQTVEINCCNQWGDAAAAAAQFAVLAPVLSGVEYLDVWDWPAPTTRTAAALPDLSCCTALAVLDFTCADEPDAELYPEQEDFWSMLAPVVQLRSLCIVGAERVNSRMVVALQHMLPRLQSVELHGCGRLLQLAGGNMQQQGQQDPEVAEEQATQKVKALLRPGLLLEVDGYADGGDDGGGAGGGDDGDSDDGSGDDDE